MNSVKPSTSESKSRNKRNIGNIETFLKRNYGLIHNPKAYEETDTINLSKIKSEFNFISQENPNKRPTTAFRTFRSTNESITDKIEHNIPKLTEQQLIEWGIDTNKILDRIIKWVKHELNNLTWISSKENTKVKGLNKVKSSTLLNKPKFNQNQMLHSVILGTDEILKKLEYFLTLVVPTLDIETNIPGSALDHLKPADNNQNNQFIKAWIRDNPILQREINFLNK